MKKYLLIIGVMFCSAAVCIGFSRDSEANLCDVTLEGVEALGGCESSSNPLLNLGGCVPEIGGAGEICAVVDDPKVPCWKTI